MVTDRGEWWCAAVVLASGACNRPAIPALRSELPASVASVSPMGYRNPDQLDPGGVLVVGASASGVQLADEIRRSGRDVMARGRRAHPSAARVSRPRHPTLDGSARRARRALRRGRRHRASAPRAVATTRRHAGKSSLDLNALRDRGVQLVGRLVGIAGGKAQFSGSLRNHCAMADLKNDAPARAHRRAGRMHHALAGDAASGRAATAADACGTARLALDSGGESARWSGPPDSGPTTPGSTCRCSMRRGTPARRRRGRCARGCTRWDCTFMRRRKSSFIHGAEDDARELGYELLAHLDALHQCEDPPQVQTVGVAM